MQKEFEKHQKIESMDETQKKEYMDQVKKEEEAIKHHQPVSIAQPFLWKKIEDRDGCATRNMPVFRRSQLSRKNLWFICQSTCQMKE